MGQTGKNKTNLLSHDGIFFLLLLKTFIPHTVNNIWPGVDLREARVKPE